MVNDHILLNDKVKHFLYYIVAKTFVENPKYRVNPVDQVMRESEWTDFVQCIIDFGNKYILKSFRLSLTMEEVDNDCI
jgi:hypothetical protein